MRICGNEFQDRILDIILKEYYSIAKLLTIERRLRILGFKLLHKFYLTNIMLLNMRDRETNKCEDCKEKDYIRQMFVYCSTLGGYWDHVSRYIKVPIALNINLMTSHKLFNIVPSYIYIHTYTYIIHTYTYTYSVQ